MKRAVLLALVVAALAVIPVLAGPKGKGWGHGRGHYGNGVFLGGFGPYGNGFGQMQGLPPGLAKRGGNLPPGLQKHLMRHGQLPPGLQKRLGNGGYLGYPGYGVNPGVYGAPYYGGFSDDAHGEFHRQQREAQRQLERQWREQHRQIHNQNRGYQNGGYYYPGSNSWLPFMFWPYR